jgi:catechol 2,3-dioxygenase
MHPDFTLKFKRANKSDRNSLIINLFYEQKMKKSRSKRKYNKPDKESGDIIDEGANGEMERSRELNSAGKGAVLHPDTDVSSVTLKVADLARSLAFYNETIGLQTLVQEDGAAVLGAGSRPIVRLIEVKGAQPQPSNTTGLYHAAILFPDRRSLAIRIAQIAETRYPFGFSDHLVSEAFYLSDPDGNGLELYRDRPRSEWIWIKDQVKMALDPIDFESFFSEIRAGDEAIDDPSAPDGTRLGHMHLRIADLEAGRKFYHDVLGFDVTASMPGALFLSAGGYHHHLGMNIWESRGGQPPAEPSAGLSEFSIALPDQAELDRLVNRVEANGISVERGEGSALVLDPFQNRVRLVLRNGPALR